MTITHAAVLGAVAIALVLTEIALVRVRREVGEANREVADLEKRLDEAVDIADAAVRRTEEAENAIEGHRRRAEAAERRAEEEVRRAEAAGRRAETADMRAHAAEVKARAGETLLVLERVRLEREWADLVGHGVPLPAGWDGSVAAAVAAELALIREIIGTPSELATVGQPSGLAPGQIAALIRLACETLRGLARTGEAMAVRITSSGLLVDQPAGTPLPDLSHLVPLARAAGAELSIDSTSERTTAELRFPAH
jgi:hypothetical protein